MTPVHSAHVPNHQAQVPQLWIKSYCQLSRIFLLHKPYKTKRISNQKPTNHEYRSSTCARITHFTKQSNISKSFAKVTSGQKRPMSESSIAVTKVQQIFFRFLTSAHERTLYLTQSCKSSQKYQLKINSLNILFWNCNGIKHTI